MRILFSLVAILLLAPVAGAQSMGEVLQDCPGLVVSSDSASQQIHLQMTDDPTKMSVIWAKTGRSMNQIVEYQWGANALEANAESYCYGNHNMAFHMATMTGLPLGEDIEYRVGTQNSQMSDWYSFTTIDPSETHFEWISIADHGDSSEAMDVSEAIIADESAQMVTVSGDIAYADGEQSAWDSWFQVQQESMTHIPWVTAVGNHENEPGYEFTPYEHRFDSDLQIESETFWYSRDVPGVHMVFMSTEHDYSVGSTQYSWIEQDLSSVNRDVTPFVIVYGHKPMYSSNSYHGSEVELRNALEELYVAQGVDLVIAGHDHFYERTWPVSAETVMDTGKDNLFSRGQGPIHLVIGIAGRSAYEDLDEPQPEWSAFRENNSYGWTRLVYDGNAGQLSLTHYRIDGTIGDQFTITESAVNDDSGDSDRLDLTSIDAVMTMIVLLSAAIRKR